LAGADVHMPLLPICHMLCCNSACGCDSNVCRLSQFSSRALAAFRKPTVLTAQAWRAAEAGQLVRLPVAGCAWRLTWRQLDIGN
jgi:hypothetical protein